MKPGHTPNPSYPPGSQFFDPDEEFCLEDQTLCEPGRRCLCCLLEAEGEGK